MKKLVLTCSIFVLSFALRAHGSPASLGWWFLPDAIEDLPVELEEDDNGYWTELWLRPGTDSTAAPNVVMEQALGARWVGINQDKDGLPADMILVLGNKIVKFNNKSEKVGTIQTDKVVVTTIILERTKIRF